MSHNTWDSQKDLFTEFKTEFDKIKTERCKAIIKQIALIDPKEDLLRKPKALSAVADFPELDEYIKQLDIV